MRKLLIFTVLASILLLSGYFLRKPRYELQLHPAEGRGLAYEFHYTLQTEAAAWMQANVFAHGIMHWQVKTLDDDAVRVTARFDCDKFTGTNLPKTENPLVLLAQFTWHRSGSISDIILDEGQDSAYTAFVIEWLRYLQQSLPAKKVAVGDFWNMIEPSRPQDFGQIVQFKNVDETIFHLEKTYENPTTGRVALTLNRHQHVIETLVLSRETKNKILGTVPTVRVTFDLHRREADPNVAIHNIQQPVPETLQQDTLLKKLRLESDLKVLQGESLEQIQARLTRLDPQDRRKNMETYLKLKAALNLHPELASRLLPALLTAPMDQESFRLPATALTAVGDEAAQKTLRDAVEQSQALDRKIRLIPNLSFTQEPSESTEQFLKRLSESAPDRGLRRTAGLALGTVAHQLRSSASARSAHILDAYAKKLEASTAAEDIDHALMVIGNIGVADQTVVLKPWLTAENPELRRRALEGLRHVPSLAAETLLLEALNREAQSGLREMAAESLSFTRLFPEHIEPVEGLVQREKNLQVIKHLLRTLALSVDEKPEVKEFIQKYAEQCAHPDLCGFVHGLASSL